MWRTLIFNTNWA